jgi:Fanconi anemia group M protein
MTNKPVNITVDSRETRSGMADRLRRISGVTVLQEELECADYTIGETILGVERKETNDLAASIMDGRIFGQIERCKATFQTTVVLIEGDMRQIRSAIAPESLDGFLSYVALLSGVQLMHSTDTEHTAALLHRMALHVTHGLGYEIPLRTGKPKDLSSIRQYLVEGLPSVGPAGAKTLLAALKTPRAVFTATRAELASIKGVGPKTIDRIFEVLG